MDIADQAQQQSDLSLEIAISNLRKNEPSLLYTGSCHYCDALVEKGCFCDSDCRDDYEKQAKLSVK